VASYNLLTEPWIPVRGKNGQVFQKGILDTLKQAHELVEVYDPAPPVQLGIYRLLIAFLMDAYQLKELESLGDVIEKGKFDLDIIERYAKEWFDRFDLFDVKHPFLQVPLNDEKKAMEPISRLMQHIPAGSNVSHFHHGNWEDNAYSFEQCARGLVTAAPFMIAGGRGKTPSINGGVPPWYVLVKGTNLFETLSYNICIIPLLVIADEDHPVAWRENGLNMEDMHNKFSIIEALTWRPRSIHLVPEECGICTYTGKQSNGLVRRMYFASGLNVSLSGSWSDPYSPYIITKEGVRPIWPQKNKELWRDIGPLMLLQQRDYFSSDKKISFQRPAIIQQFKQLIEEGIIKKSQPLIIEVYGIRTNENPLHPKLMEWYFERLVLPETLLSKKNVGKYVQEAMDYSDNVAYAIRAALKKAYPDIKANGKALDNLILRSQSMYWRHLKPLFREQVLQRLSEIDENNPDAPAIILQDWKKTLEKEGYRAFNESIGPLDADGNMLRRQVEATEYFWMIARSQLYPEAAAERKRKKNKEKNNV
jgi:CRISPR system Cascade subunit CasA